MQSLTTTIALVFAFLCVAWASESCWTVPGDVICVGDMSTAATHAQDSNGFLMKSYGDSVNTPSGIVGLWLFDTSDGADSSNYVNGFSSPVPPLGVGILRGSSGYFSGVTTYSIPHIDAYSQYAEGTISAWIYLLSEVEDNFRVIVKKGDGKDFDAFELKVWPTTRLLRASAGSLSVNTEASLPITKWTHVAVRVSPTSLEVYMNGVLTGATKISSVQASVSPLQMNKHPLYVASTQDMSSFGIHAYIDNLKWTKGLLSLPELRAEAALASWGIPGGMEMAWLGCDECTRAQAIDICDQKNIEADVAESLTRAPSHLCTEMELSAGALTVARSMGWLSLSAKLPIFTLDDKKVGASAVGVGLCCLNE